MKETKPKNPCGDVDDMIFVDEWFASERCSTITPFGRPVDPEV